MTDLNPQPTIKPVAAIAIKQAAIVDSGMREANKEKTDINTTKHTASSESESNLTATTRQHASADVAPELYTTKTQGSLQ
jgi:hypothetical protein